MISLDSILNSTIDKNNGNGGPRIIQQNDDRGAGLCHDIAVAADGSASIVVAGSAAWHSVGKVTDRLLTIPEAFTLAGMD